jgi:hypothetical protein
MQYAHSMAVEIKKAEMGSHAHSVPLFINEDRAEMRGIKAGWYAISNDGNFVGGPFTTYETCLERNPGQS